MYGNPAFECGGAQVRTVCRQLATVVTVQGVVDDTNVERVTALALRSIIAEKPFVLGLPTGSSPIPTYKHLIGLVKAGKLS